MTRQHLYFILNPALGLIKIGIAADVADRRKGLECGCGVPLDVLHVVEHGAPFEKDLHDAFGPDRQLGEWFLPSARLLSLVGATTEQIVEFLDDAETEIRAFRQARDDAFQARKAARAEASRKEREEAQRLKEKAERLRAKRADNLKRQREKEAAVRVQHEAEQRVRIDAERAAWAERNPQIAASVIRNEEAQARRAKFAELQRERNAALLGVAAQ